MTLCEEVEQLCALPQKIGADKAEDLRSHYVGCKKCQRCVRFRLMAGKMIERVFDGRRVEPFDDLETLDQRVDARDQGGTKHSRKLRRAGRR